MNILGQEKQIAYLADLVQSGRVAGAFLFSGPDGVGKKLAAFELAKALNCQHPLQGRACGECASCVAIDKQLHPDVTLVDFAYQAYLKMKGDPSDKDYAEEFEDLLSKQQHLLVDTIRSATNKSQQTAVRNGWKVLIVDQAQTMERSAANALLKFIEEPAAKTVWILLTSKRSAMLPTILSRCRSVVFSALPEETVAQILTENNLPVEDASLAAKYSGGSVSQALAADKALSLLQSGEFNTPQGAAQIAGALPRTMAAARREAQAVLDVLSLLLYRAWKTQTDVARQQEFQQRLNRLETYKKAIGRNVAPALVLETALMGLDGTNLSL